MSGVGRVEQHTVCRSAVRSGYASDNFRKLKRIVDRQAIQTGEIGMLRKRISYAERLVESVIVTQGDSQVT